MLCCDYNKNCCLFELVCLLVLSEGGEKNLAGGASRLRLTYHVPSECNRQIIVPPHRLCSDYSMRGEDSHILSTLGTPGNKAR